VIGHVDAGKSTLMGHLLFLLGYVDSKTISKYERDSKAIGKDSFHFAWVMDAGEEERQRGVTIDVGCGHFSTENRSVTLLDAPGHKDFIPNMISGAAQADAAVLVVDASIGEFEKGFQGTGTTHGQTKEHSHVARALGVDYVIVAVNKLDNVDWDRNRFEYIRAELEGFLRFAGFREVFFVPISGLKGDNLKERSKSRLLDWYQGKTLVQLIDSIPKPPRNLCKPLRMCVMDSYKLSHGSIVGQVFSGRVEGGQVKLQDKLLLSPCGISGIVKQIELGTEVVSQASAGDSVSISLKEVTGDFSLVVPGDVVSAFSFPVPLVRRFIAKVYTFDIIFPITKGLSLVMFIQSLRVSVKVASIKDQLDPVTGAVIKSHPRCLTRNMKAIIEIEANTRICLEKFSNYKGLGRVLFRDRSETVMAGMVTELLE
jgi:elongation factor 1 alpha-like protein